MATKKSAGAVATSVATNGKKGAGRAKASAAGDAGERAPAAAPGASHDGFVDAGRGYALGLRDGTLICRNAKGQVLGSVPKDLRDGEVGEQLLAVVDFLKAHEREVSQTVEGWMLRSMPTPTAVLLAAWPDESYRRSLENLVVVVEPKATGEASVTGFLKGVDAKKGVGVVDLDGETIWTKAEAFVVPHPILLADLEELRGLAAELSFSQGQKQLFREVFTKPNELGPEQEEIASFRGGKFEQLSHARGAAKSLGYRTAGGWAACRVFEGGKTTEARFWLGGDDSMDEVVTEGLMWVDASGDTILVKDVPPIAFSEGMRMASAIYGKRAVEKKDEDDDA
ncbi:MAG: DUF4132 domain-containing protein [Myxococcales bacterium]|nr:DUF4132 domain-containing protein [Myxococcales bacterium]HQY61085.1 DUF4132 domain-containing protein [Polyangiaceae bacterium]